MGIGYTKNADITYSLLNLIYQMDCILSVEDEKTHKYDMAKNTRSIAEYWLKNDENLSYSIIVNAQPITKFLDSFQTFPEERRNLKKLLVRICNDEIIEKRIGV